MSRSNGDSQQEDSDLADLLGNDVMAKQQQSSGSRPAYQAGTETTSMNLDHLTSGKHNVKNSPSNRTGSKSSSSSSQYYNNNHNLSASPFLVLRAILHRVSGILSALCYFYPRFCGCFAFVLVFLCMIGFVNLFFNPVEEFGHITHDHSNIHSVYDVKLGDVDHWCLQGGDTGCPCDDPLFPMARLDHRSWIEAFKSNRRIVAQYQDPVKANQLDVVILGGSAVEEMDGRWMGRVRSTELKNLATTFMLRFRKDKGASVEGVALGIAGDSSPNVLWRIMHGEMPDYLNPKVWWISVGNNDLGRMECSEEVVVLGVLRLVEEILNKRPNARIVINSLFPMMNVRGHAYPMIHDYQDGIKGRTNRVFQRPSLPVRPPEGGENGAAVSHITFPHNMVVPPRPPPPVQGGGRHLALFPVPEGPRERSSAVFTTVSSSSEAEEKIAADIDREELERERRSQGSWLKRHHEARIQHRHESNPIMIDRDHIRKYDARTAFTQKRDLPLWTAIRAINKQLQAFAAKHEKVEFFDATPIFVQSEGGGTNRYRIMTDKISTQGHPTPYGFSVWEDAIVARVEKILTEMRATNPELFAAVKQVYTANDDGSTGSSGQKDTVDGATGSTDDDAVYYGDDNTGDAITDDDDGGELVEFDDEDFGLGAVVDDDQFDDDVFRILTDDFLMDDDAASMDDAVN